ncbi:MAG: hypothetical protein WCI80_01330 [Bacteroidota bacterium]
MANRYWVGGTGTWDTTTTTNWSATSGGAGGASVPATTDQVIFDSLSNQAGSGASYTCTRTATTAVLGINMDNPSAGTLTFAGSAAISISTGGLTVASGVSWTETGLITVTGSCTLTTNGVVLSAGLTINASGGTVNLGSAYNGLLGLATSLTLTSGTFNTNGYTLTMNGISSSGASSRTLNITNSIVYCDKGTLNFSNKTNLTLISTGSTIYIGDGSANSTFGYGLTYNNIIFFHSPFYASFNINYSLSGANTFTGTIANTRPILFSITFPVSITQDINNWTASGQSSAILTLKSATAGTQATLNLTGGGTVSVDYLSIQDISATPSSLTWYAGTHSTNVSNNTGWIFSSPSTPPNVNFFAFFNGS